MKKFLLSVLFTLSLFCNTAFAQDYTLRLALSNFQGTYSDGSDIVAIHESPSSDIFLANTWQSFVDSLNSFGPELLDVQAANGVSFKNYVLANLQIPNVIDSLVQWVLTDQQPADREDADHEVHFLKTGGAAGGLGEEFCAHYEDTIHTAEPVEVVVYIKKLAEVAN